MEGDKNISWKYIIELILLGLMTLLFFKNQIKVIYGLSSLGEYSSINQLYFLFGIIIAILVIPLMIIYLFYGLKKLEENKLIKTSLMISYSLTLLVLLTIFFKNIIGLILYNMGTIFYIILFIIYIVPLIFAIVSIINRKKEVNS